MFTIVIQSGGESQRMGQDKGLVKFLGQPLIVRVVNRLRPIADEILVTTNRPEAYEFLEVKLVPDEIPGRGALGGLYTALKAACHPVVGVVACDMPFANPDLMAAQRDLLTTSNTDIVIPQVDAGPEPFHAVYRRDTCLPHIEAALQSNRWRVTSWFDRVKVHVLTPEELHPFDPHELAFLNVNTPEELRHAESLAAIDA